jgi:hypothetical protein
VSHTYKIGSTLTASPCIRQRRTAPKIQDFKIIAIPHKNKFDITLQEKSYKKTDKQ